jgi:LysM repeat protein
VFLVISLFRLNTICLRLGGMKRVPGWLFIAVCALCVAGCTGTADTTNDEQNPHFQRAQDMVNLQDFKGAISEFEKVLQVNPQSAESHFQLGCVSENDKIRDYGAAIYHYEKYLQLKPDFGRATQVHDRIRACKRELANGEFPLPTSQNLQKDVDQLTADNMVLKRQVADLKGQLANAQLELTNQAVMITTLRAQAATQIQTSAGQASARTGLGTVQSGPRVYQVQEGDTISGIAARFRLKTSAILAANPKIRPERLRIGQNIKLPIQ